MADSKPAQSSSAPVQVEGLSRRDHFVKDLAAAFIMHKGTYSSAESLARTTVEYVDRLLAELDKTH